MNDIRMTYKYKYVTQLQNQSFTSKYTFWLRKEKKPKQKLSYIYEKKALL